MITVRLKHNIRLIEVDRFVQKFIEKEGCQHFNIDIKLTDTECLIFFFKKLN